MNNFSADLQALNALLASYHPALEGMLTEKAGRLDPHLLKTSPGFLLPPDLDLEAMTATELQALCRRKHLRGWSKLRRAELVAFVQRELASEIQIMQLLRDQTNQSAGQTHPCPVPGSNQRHPACKAGALPLS